MSSRKLLLEQAIKALEKDDPDTAASLLEQSSDAIDCENARNCKNLAVSGDAQLIAAQTQILKQHLEMENLFGGQS